jgi:hypothetical protein
MTESAIFHIEGGVGKHIAASSVLKAYHNNNPETKIIVSCAYPEIFYNNPIVEKSLKLGNNQYFYKDYIYKKNVEIYAQEPYKQTSHITKKTHLIQTWCDMIGSQYNNETPEIYLNFREKEISKNLIKFKDQKPILIFQPFGGPGSPTQQLPYSWARDIHPAVAQDIVNELSEKYNIIHICYDNHPILNNCLRIDQHMSKKVLISLLLYSNKRILIDSCLQHAAAALGLSSTVVWNVTKPEIFGYSLHDNILPKISYPEGTANSYLFDYDIMGNIDECLHVDYNQIVDIEKILNSVH